MCVPEHMTVAVVAVLAANDIAVLVRQALLTLEVVAVLADIPVQAAKAKTAPALRLAPQPDVVLVEVVAVAVLTVAHPVLVLVVAVVVLAFMGRAQMEPQVLQAQTALDEADQAEQTALLVLLALVTATVVDLAAGRAVSVSDRLVALMVGLAPMEQFVLFGPVTPALSLQPLLVHPNV